MELIILMGALWLIGTILMVIYEIFALIVELTGRSGGSGDEAVQENAEPPRGGGGKTEFGRPGVSLGGVGRYCCPFPLRLLPQFNVPALSAVPS